jgi:hypothetical protein
MTRWSPFANTRKPFETDNPYCFTSRLVILRFMAEFAQKNAVSGSPRGMKTLIPSISNENYRYY